MYECNGWMSLYQMEFYVNEADLTCGANYRNTGAGDHDRNKSAYFRRRLVFFDITLNPNPKYICCRVIYKKKNLGYFNFTSCKAVHFIMTDPGEFKVTIWPLATITDPCFNMQMNRFLQPLCNHECDPAEKPNNHVHV